MVNRSASFAEKRQMARLLDLSFGFNGKQRLTLELDADFRKTFDDLKDCEVDLKVSKKRKKRSLDANAYAWVLIDKIAEKRCLSKSEVYRNAIRDIGGVSEIVCVQNKAKQSMIDAWTHFGVGWQVDELESKIEGCTNLVLYKGSSVYDTKQMNALIDSLVQDAQSIGIETMPPEKLESLLREKNNA